MADYSLLCVETGGYYSRVKKTLEQDSILNFDGKEFLYPPLFSFFGEDDAESWMTQRQIDTTGLDKKARFYEECYICIPNVEITLVGAQHFTESKFGKDAYFIQFSQLIVFGDNKLFILAVCEAVDNWNITNYLIIDRNNRIELIRKWK
jgi:hypothetical protein